MTSSIDPPRIPLEEVLARLGEEAADAVVYVSRQPGGREVGGKVALSALDNFHIRQVSGGRNEVSYFPHLYAYGSCMDLPVGHSGSHGDCPHQILACVTHADREDVWEALCELTGHEIPTDDVVQEERETVKRDVLERFDACNREGELQERAEAAIPMMFNQAVGRDVGPFINALAPSDRRLMWDLKWYFDRQTGAVVMVDKWSDEDMSEHPLEEERYEHIEPLSEEEVELLTLEDLREIRNAFLASRGFKP